MRIVLARMEVTAQMTSNKSMEDPKLIGIKAVPQWDDDDEVDE